MAPDRTPADHDADPDPAVAEYVGEHAPELDPADVAAFMADHPKPGDERGPHVAWAVRVMREVGEGEVGDGLAVDRVVSEIRQIRRRDG